MKNERDTNTADINLVAHILDVCMVFIYNIQSVMETKIKNKTATFYLMLFLNLAKISKNILRSGFK